MPRSASSLRRLARYASGHRRHVVAATTFSVLDKLFDIAPPFLMGIAIDVVVEREDSLVADWFGIESTRAQLVALAVATFVIWAFESLFDYLQQLSWRNLAQSVEHELRIDAYDHVQELELAFFEDRSSGGLMAVLNDDVNQLERFLDHGANDLVQLFVSVALIGGSFIVLAPSVAVLAFLPMPVIVWGSLRFQRRLEPRYAEVRRRAGIVNEELGNNLGGIATIKSFTAEARETDRIAAASTRYRIANRDAIRISSAFTPLIRIAILFGFMATLVWGGFLTLDGRLAESVYVTLVFMTQRLLWPLTSLGETLDLYQRGMASTTRILDVLDTRPSIVDGPRAMPAESIAGSVAFDDVSFSYATGPPVIGSVSVEIPAGDTVAFVGSTGAGKTTLVKLLLRFYDPTAGTITLDGVDIREMKLADLRSAVGLVGQDVFLFDGTVRANIAYGRPGASDDEIAAAAAVAEADRFIAGLALGYDTIVGERGQKLSAGQRQRISIARAVLADPPILVLDEATASVDNETEAAIQRSLERITDHRTTIVIAHRLSTIRHADRIYVVEGGRIVEGGSHDQLCDLGGRYRALWDVQTGQAVHH